MRLAANGAVSMSGYAGKTQVGVIMWIGNTLLIYEHRHEVDEPKKNSLQSRPQDEIQAGTCSGAQSRVYPEQDLQGLEEPNTAMWSTELAYVDQDNGNAGNYKNSGPTDRGQRTTYDTNCQGLSAIKTFHHCGKAL